MKLNRVQISDIIDARRMDPIFFRFGTSRFGIKYKLMPISSVSVDMQSGFGAGKGDQADEHSGIIHIRPTNLDNNGNLIFEKNIYVPSTLNKTLLEVDDVLFNNTNSQELVGKTAILKEERQLFFSNHITRIKVDKNLIIPEYLWIILNMYQREKIFYSICTNWNNQSGVGVELLKSIRIPLPPIEVQREIVELYTKAQNEKQAKEQQATELLSGIDTFLLDQLGIILPETDNNPFIILKLSELIGNTFDYKSNKFKSAKMTSICYEEVALSSIASLSKGSSITKDKITEGSYPVIAGGQTSPYSNNEYNQLEDVITVSASGAYAGYVWYHNYKIFASDCSVIRSIEQNYISTKYIYEILRLKQQEIYKMQRGSGQPHVYLSELSKITIPIPPIEKQDEIASHIMEIRTKAKQLQQDGATLLAEARNKIEKIILG